MAQPAWGPGDRRELLSRLAVDQAIRDTFVAQIREGGTITPELGRRMNAIDSANTAWLKPRIAAAGWPKRATVDSDGVDAAFLMVQHADLDPAFQEQALPLLESAYRAGEVPGGDLALLTDRVAKARGRRQRYGTQTTIVKGRAIIDPIEDSAGVDGRRASLGLPPLGVYQRLLDSMLTAPPQP
jgi:hypothetical protein